MHFQSLKAEKRKLQIKLRCNVVINDTVQSKSRSEMKQSEAFTNSLKSQFVGLTLCG